jgi:hypothetical protein
MKKIFSPGVLALIALVTLSEPTRAGVVYTPIGSGQAAGSAYFGFVASFDDQPVIGELVNNQAVVPVTGSLGNNPDTYATSQGYIDFGVGFASIQIDGLWTAYRAYSSVSTPVAFTDLWWSDTNNNVRGVSGTFTDINPAAFNFGTKPIASTNSVVWTQDFDLSGAPVTVQRRFLIVSGPSNWGGGGRVTELAITAIPEPATGILLGVGLVSCLFFRQRNRF